MPAVRSYEVEETRQVVVAAISPAEAIQKAEAIFRGLDDNPKLDSQGSVLTGPVRTTYISAREG